MANTQWPSSPGTGVASYPGSASHEAASPWAQLKWLKLTYPSPSQETFCVTEQGTLLGVGLSLPIVRGEGDQETEVEAHRAERYRERWGDA